MPDLVPFEEIVHLFDDFEHTAWRLETQHGYATDRVSPNWARWKAGEKLGFDPSSPWHVSVQAKAAEGRRFARVRLVDSPPTEGQSFLLASGLGNVEAGEDIRNLYRSEARRIGLPNFDFWLFDSRILAKFVIDKDGVTVGVEVTEEPAAVLVACQARDAAWHYAVPTREFQAQLPSDL
ncbi:DUF6879 family protein [Streptomyces sp. NPDC050844]|uniref:DUF6879 family protein n=1 Tax=Streptomyces sp. NPDC050844 TaxID=3155790 RepID=UPI0033C0D7C3